MYLKLDAICNFFLFDAIYNSLFLSICLLFLMLLFLNCFFLFFVFLFEFFSFLNYFFWILKLLASYFCDIFLSLIFLTRCFWKFNQFWKSIFWLVGFENYCCDYLVTFFDSLVMKLLIAKFRPILFLNFFWELLLFFWCLIFFLINLILIDYQKNSF